MSKKISNQKRERIKTVKITTKTAEHRCTAECFEPRRQPAPKGLEIISFGEIYQDDEGKFYREWGDGEWLEVTGVTFLSRSDGELGIMFHPKHQLHIHSPRGRTVAQTTT